MLWNSHFARLGQRYEGDVMGLCDVGFSSRGVLRCYDVYSLKVVPNMMHSLLLLACQSIWSSVARRLRSEWTDCLESLQTIKLEARDVDLVKFPTGGSVKVFFFFIKHPVNIGLQLLYTVLEQRIINKSSEQTSNGDSGITTSYSNTDVSEWHIFSEVSQTWEETRTFR